MISVVVDLPGKFYVNNDLANVQVITRTVHAAGTLRSGLTPVSRFSVFGFQLPAVNR